MTTADPSLSANELDELCQKWEEETVAWGGDSHRELKE